MAASSPSAHATIGAPESWAAPFGAPGRAERDPGTHFTATSVTKLCDPWDLRWNRHLAYSPTVAGYIGRANGSLERELGLIEKQGSFQQALDVAYFCKVKETD